MGAALSRLSAFGLEVVPVSAERAVNSAVTKQERKIPYADAFGVDLAGDSGDHVLVTADFEVKPAKQDVRIEFLPLKAKP
jgi:predicted nucleic acid-binding protein